MRLKRTITRKLKEEQLKPITRYGVINSKELQADGTYLVNYTRYSQGSYESIVNRLVKEKYSADEESAIQRKAIMNGITEEFITYNAYVEQCKVEAKAFIEERNSIIGR